MKRDANAEECEYLFERAERELFDFLTGFIFDWGAALQYADSFKKFKIKNDFPNPTSLPTHYDKLYYNWATDYGPVVIVFQVKHKLAPHDTEWGSIVDGVIKHQRRNEFQLFIRGYDDYYPIPVLEKLTEATEAMIGRFLPKVQPINTWRQCASDVHFLGTNFPSTIPQMRIVQKVGDRFLCDSCIDRFSLAAHSVVEDSAKSKSPADIERAKMSVRLRFSILERDGFTCKGCGHSPLKGDNIKLHVDHILPIARGGKTVSENLQTLCDACNLGKTDKLVEQMLIFQ